VTPFDEELQVGLNGIEIDVLRVTSWHEWVVIVWHEIDGARSWLTVG
jgi:hypothetical protein